MDTYALLGTLVLEDRLVPDGALIVENGIITYAGRASGTEVPEDTRCVDGLIAPGFVDIHCHGSDGVYCHMDPLAGVKHHFEHGTTGLLLTMYRNVPIPTVHECIDKLKEISKEYTNVLGVHLEGPYLNPEYGSGEGVEVPIVKEEYEALINTGFIRQWTFSPEVPGTIEVIKAVAEAGIVPAIGHSNASPEDVNAACDAGAMIVTHLFDATGSSISPTRYGGTVETTFDFAALVRDDLFYEIICDRNGIHVRPEMTKLAIKTAGIDRIVGITDCVGGSPDDTDVNFVNGELTGSKLTMDKVAKNFYNLGLSIPDVFKVCSLNPACAIGYDHIIGSLEEGKRADVLILNHNLDLLEVHKA